MPLSHLTLTTVTHYFPHLVCLLCQTPAYVTDLLHPYSSARSLRSNMLNLLSVPCPRLKTHGDRAFEAVARKLWNDLPAPLRSADSVD